MTEDEAKTKWCPLGKGTVSAEFGPEPANCIGSACMMWRRNETQERKWFPSLSVPQGWYYTGNMKGSETTAGTEMEYYRNVEGGFCGLAGKP